MCYESFESSITELFVSFSVFALASMFNCLISMARLIHYALGGTADPREVAFCFRHLMWDVIVKCLFYTLSNNIPFLIDKPVR